MRHLRPLALSMILALLAALPALAQEEAAAAPAPAGITMLLLLAGLGAVALIGFVINTREGENQDES